MTPHFADDALTLYLGDCVEVMASLEPESVDAIVTDPPYNLGFMGRAWDTKHQHEPWAREALRVAKPGAHLLAFGGTRTVHRLAAAIEDAGWEIRDCLVWAYASGFPKSLDVSKALDRAAGAEREIGPKLHPGSPTAGGTLRQRASSFDGQQIVTAPATPEAAKWQGWGTALKPAWEPIVLARKPLRGTVARNVSEFGTGALNIDGTRIAFQGVSDRLTATVGGKVTSGQAGHQAEPNVGQKDRREFEQVLSDRGRWPANVILTDPIFDGGVDGVVGGGEVDAGGPKTGGASGGFTEGWNGLTRHEGYGDSGTYSRFFLIPKADRADREPVLGGLEERAFGQSGGAQAAIARGEDYQGADASTGLNRVKHRANHHPTVKPVELMRHLVRLVTPPNGLVLDPFVGSGSTLLAAEMEGFRSIGIDKEAEYVEITQARLRGVQRGLGIA